MSVITQDFVAAGKPTYITANAGVMYTDITDGIVYKQTTIPYGKNWKVVSNQNVYIPSSGVISVNATTPLASSGGTGPTISIQQAGPTQDGYLSSADWNTFNAGSGGGVPTTRTINTTTPLQGGGDLSTDRTLSISQADSTTDGYLASTDWNTFDNKYDTPTGTTSEYVRGDGSLATFPTVPSVTPSALTKTDDTNVTLALTGTPNSALLQAVNIAVGWSGTLADSRIASASTWNSKVSSIGATSPITSSGGATPTISTSMNTNKLIGRSTAGLGVMEEITVGTGLTLSAGTLSASITNSITHATAAGTDTYTATITGVTSYADGDCYLIRFTNGNTTSSTLNINSLGAIDLYRNNDGLLIGGDIVAGSEMLVVYNSTLTGFQCIGTAPNTLLAYVTNAESITINKGQPVYVFGGQGDRITVKLAYNTTDMTSAQTIGVVQSTSIAAGQKGLVIVQGQLDGLTLFPTSTWADGDYVYLGATAGTITNVKPSAPNHLVYLGYVTTASNGAAGRWYVKVQNGYELKELHDVQANSPTNKDVLYYESTAQQWKANSIASVLGYTPADASTAVTSVTGTSPVVSSGGTTPAISMAAATTSVNGYLTSTDWTTFNSRQISPWAYRLSGKWWTPSNNALSIGSLGNVANSIRFSPFIVEKDITITQLGIAVVTIAGAGNTARVGIYSNNASTNQPLTRLVDSGTLAVDSTGTKTATGLSVALTRGLYWFAYFTNASTGTVASIANLNLPDVIGVGTSLQLGIITGYSQSLSYTSLPATASGLSNLLSGASSYCVFYYY
jgi:hypothetical protein